MIPGVASFYVVTRNLFPLDKTPVVLFSLFITPLSSAGLGVSSEEI
jgi:hypothetical protein